MTQNQLAIFLVQYFPKLSGKKAIQILKITNSYTELFRSFTQLGKIIFILPMICISIIELLVNWYWGIMLFIAKIFRKYLVK